MASVIITAASPAYELSLLALLGSINLNWSTHPRVVVFDLGMSDSTLAILSDADIEVIKVEEFCPHWRKYFAWKLWCFNNAPADQYLWLDAGTCVLAPIDEAMIAAKQLGYFCVTNHFPLAPTLSEPQRISVGLTPETVKTLVSIGSGVHAFDRNLASALLEEGLEHAMDEATMKPTDPWHRHDQSLLTALLHKHFDPVVFSDHGIYCNPNGPTDVVQQKVWVHRKRMRLADQEFLAKHVAQPGDTFIPSSLPIVKPPSHLKKVRMFFAHLRGRTPKSDKAGTVIYDGVKD